MDYASWILIYWISTGISFSIPHSKFQLDRLRCEDVGNMTHIHLHIGTNFRICRFSAKPITGDGQTKRRIDRKRDRWTG